MSETVEERTRKRRWLSLAELVAVAGLLIGGIGLYLNWSDRREAVAERAVSSAGEARARAAFELRGKVAAGNRSVMLLRDDAHALGDVTVAFPTALGVATKDAIGHTIDSDWFAEPLLKATDGGADESAGRLPVLVTYRYTHTLSDETFTRSAIYDVIWSTSGRFLQGRSLAIIDFRLRERGASPARLNALWRPPAKE